MYRRFTILSFGEYLLRSGSRRGLERSSIPAREMPLGRKDFVKDRYTPRHLQVEVESQPLKCGRETVRWSLRLGF